MAVSSAKRRTCETMSGKVVHVDKEKDQVQHSSRCNWNWIRLLALNNDFLLTVTEEGLYPAQRGYF